MKKVFFLLSILVLYGCAASEKLIDLENRISTLESQLQNVGEEFQQLKKSNDGLINALSQTIDSKNSQLTSPQLPPIVVDKTATVTNSGQCKAITKAGTQCKRSAQAGSDFCWQHQGASTSKKETSVTSSSNDRTIYTGPRGGQYYYNSKGKKTYIRKK